MGQIHVLGFDVANLIAAGEVVDRPASVVKELLENAIDAGARSVTVEIQKGGVSFLRVADDGCGMEPEDLPVAVLRHATSKIQSAKDLDGIATLGFRGEALAAISSVAKVRIFSKTDKAEYGALLQCEGGSVVSVTETGCAKGTTVIVEELFYNVPARRKFLKKDSTETVAVTGVVEKIALSSPHISIKYITDGELKFVTAGDGNLKNTIYALYGRETASRLLPVDRAEGGIRVTGFVSDPSLVRSNRNQENFFINGRYIRSRTAAAALEQAFVSRIPSDKFPFCVLNLELNPAAVDVNVHPAKLEVKFSDEKRIFDAVYYAVMSPLEQVLLRPELRLHSRPMENPPTAENPVVPEKNTEEKREPPISTPTASSGEKPFWISGEEARKLFSATTARGETVNAQRAQVKIEAPGMTAAASPTYETSEEDTGLRMDNPFKDRLTQSVSPLSSVPAASEPLESAPAEAPAVGNKPEEKPEVPDYVIIGEAYNTYVIVQLEDRLVLIDKHAAHERILFDRLSAALRGQPRSSQLLLAPLHVSMTEGQVYALVENRERIEAVGFGFAQTENGVSVSEIPTDVCKEQATELLLTLADRLMEGTGTVESTSLSFFESRLYQASCKAAIKGGRLYALENIRWICDRILQKPKDGSVIRTCPHGRPVAFEIRKNSIERQFSRIL